MTGGYVYWGEDIPALLGAYVFADLCQGRLAGLRFANGRARDQGELGPEGANVSSFGEETAGELYVLSLSGRVFRLVPAQDRTRGRGDRFEGSTAQARAPTRRPRDERLRATNA